MLHFNLGLLPMFWSLNYIYIYLLISLHAHPFGFYMHDLTLHLILWGEEVSFELELIFVLELDFKVH